MKPSQPADQLDPTIFIIFGAAGDLMWCKLTPALFDLSQDRSLPTQFAPSCRDFVANSEQPGSPRRSTTSSHGHANPSPSSR